MVTLTNVAFAGYAYYSRGGEGFVYALSSNDTESIGLPVILINSSAKAANFFSLLLLLASGVLMLSLICLLLVALCCRRKVAELEEVYWKLQYAFANVNDALVRELSRHTPSAAATSSASINQKRASQSNIRLAAGAQAQSQMMQRHGSTASMTSMRQPQQVMEPPPTAAVFPATPPPYSVNVNPLYLQPVNASTVSANNYSYGDNYAQASLFASQAPPISIPQQQQQTRISGGLMTSPSPGATPDPPLRRRASKIQQQQQRQPAMQNMYVGLIPLTYSGAVPAPAPACTDPTPDEQHRQAVAQKKEALNKKEQQQQTFSGSGEIFANFKKAVSQAVISIEKGATDVSTRTEAQVRQLEYQHDCDRFRLHFQEIANEGEVLLADYRCSAMHGGNSVSGHLQITRHYLCFFAETSSSIAKTTDVVMDAFAAARQAASSNSSAPANIDRRQRLLGIKEVISLAQIASIQPSVVLETVAGHAPFFLQLPASTVCATALQVYTKDKKLYQFMKFESLISRASGALSDYKGTALDCAYNYLDHAWREFVTVPLNDVEYA